MNDETPLHWCQTWSAVKLLVDAGAITHDVDKTGRSPVLFAAFKKLFTQNPNYFYPDVTDDPTTFWKLVSGNGFDVLTCDKDGNSVISYLLREENFALTKGLVEAVCDESLVVKVEALISVLNAICKDRSTQTEWKTLLIQMILKLLRRPIDLSSCLRYCCLNIRRNTSSNINRYFSRTSEAGITDSVHFQIAKQLLLHGASGECCLDLAERCRELKDFLTTPPLSIDEVPIVIPWTSYSKTHKKKLAEVARNRKCESVEGSFYWHYNEPIGSGAFGLVFAGINEKDGMEVAVKRIEKLRMVRPEDKREIRTFSALTKCNQIVRYLGFWESSDFAYVVLELMEGSLDDFFSSTCYDPDKSTTLSKDIVLGLQYLHEQDILHRDLKPSNILYKTHPNPCLKIADFGLSRPSNMNFSKTVMSTIGIGTRGWIAPEVMKSCEHVHTKSSDIFSCGLVLHYLFAKQQHPFDATAGKVDKSDAQILLEREFNISKYKLDGWCNSLPPEVSHLVRNMIGNDDKQRPSASDSLNHPMFWSDKKKMDFLSAVGNQSEFECPRVKRPSLTPVENDLEGSFSTKIKFGKWDDTRYKHMPTIYAEMTQPIVKIDKKGKTSTVPSRKYDTGSAVELVRFIRNASAHASNPSRSALSRRLVLSDCVFLEEFPNLLIEVYKAVVKHGWDTREEIQQVLKN